MWEVKGKIEGNKCKPHGSLFSPDDQVLLVAGGPNRRVIVLNPQDSSVLQTIQLDQLGFITDIHIHQQQFIVHHVTTDNKKKGLVFFYYVKCVKLSKSLFSIYLFCYLCFCPFTVYNVVNITNTFMKNSQTHKIYMR